MSDTYPVSENDLMMIVAIMDAFLEIKEREERAAVESVVVRDDDPLNLLANGFVSMQMNQLVELQELRDRLFLMLPEEMLHDR